MLVYILRVLCAKILKLPIRSTLLSIATDNN